jgi:hypothetical protein
VEFSPEKHATIEELVAAGDSLMYKQKNQKDNAAY